MIIQDFVLEKDYKYNPHTDLKYLEGAVLNCNKRILIDGNCHTINGNNLSRIFYINKGLVEFKDINFINGNADGWLKAYGGAIYSESTLHITNCTFKNNNMIGTMLTPTKGGAIYTEKNLYLEDSNFINNYVGGLSADGGAVYSRNQVFATNCKFTRNHAKEDGGAIYSSESANINHCYFYNNTAYSGACIYMDGNTELDC